MSYCTDREPYNNLKGGDRVDRATMDLCKRWKTGGMDKHAIAQMLAYGSYYSSAELASLALFLRSPGSMTADEVRVLNASFDIARAAYDRLMNQKLLEDCRFAANAKIILLLRSFDPDDLNTALGEKLQLNISLRKEETV
jgi:hypothetical protein